MNNNNNNKDLDKDIKVDKNLLEDKNIFIPEEDEIVMNCEGEPCNFSYFQE